MDIQDDLLTFAKRRAAEAHTTLTSVVEDALRILKGRTKAGGSSALSNIKLRTISGHGLQPGVDLDNTAELLDRMEGRL